MTPADNAARQRALDIHRSFAVAAPAGSGKTGLLTQRVLALLAQVANPEEILCLTFTRKAAGEMRQRIVTALQQAAGPAPENLSPYDSQTRQLALGALARDREQGWQLLKSPNRLRIQTIDSCCRNLSAQLTQESGLGDNLEPLDIATPLYLEAIRESLLTDMERKGPAGDAIEIILQHLDNDLNKLERLLLALLQNRDQWLGHLLQAGGAREHLEAFLQELIEDSLQRATQQLISVGSELAMLADYAAGNLQQSDSPLRTCLGLTALPNPSAHELPQWQALAGLLLTNGDEWRSDRGVNIRIGFPTAKQDPEFGEIRKQQFQAFLGWCRNHPELQDALLDIRYLPPLHYPDNQWQVLNALALLLPLLAARLSLVFQQHGRCDFTEIASAALRALGDDDNPTDLALRLDYRLRHILVDEFQDTSSLQYELLRRLTRGWMPDDGRSLFIVGDGMQSLYGFRNANVGLFLQARQQGLGDIHLEALDLTVNFRSQQGVIDWVNQVFKSAFPAHHNINRGAVSYTDADAVKPGLPGTAVSIDCFADYPEMALAQQAEARHIVALVENAKARDPNGSIAILVRNRGHLQSVLRELNAADHSWQAQDIEPLGKQMAVVDLLSLTRALNGAADRIAWLSILRAPWCGLDLNDLYYLTNGDTTQQGSYPLLLSQLENFRDIAAISAPGKQILSRVAPLLCNAWQQRRRKSLRIAIEGLWLALGGSYGLENQYELNSCIDFLNLIEKFESAGEITDWRAFELAVERLYAAPREAGNPQLQVMTIHKAKGLEFDTVIIPGLNRGGAADNADLLLWREGIAGNGQPQLFIGPISATGAEQDPLYNHLKRERALKGQLENARVFYVGATRAVKHLHLTFCLDNGKKPTANSLLNCLWPSLESQSQHYQIHSDDQPELPASADNKFFLKRLPPSWQSPQPNTVTTIANTTGGDWEDENPQQRHTGTLLHRILEATVREQWPLTNTTWQQQQPFWRQQLRQLGVADIPLAMEYLSRATTTLSNDHENHWLFDTTLEGSACELALGHFDANGNAKTAVVDRTFIRQNRRWIVDYKLAEPTPGTSVEDFLNTQQQRYLPQLQHYSELFKAREQRETVLALYFPLLPRLLILS